MKKMVTMLGATAALAGCMSAPDDTQSFRNMSGNHMLLTTKSFHVNRSLGAVNASLAAGAEKCFQRTTRQTVYGGSTPYGRSSAQVVRKFSYEMNRTSTGAELGLHARQVNANFMTPDKNGGYIYLVETRAASGGTAVTLHTGKFGYRHLDDAMRGWASGAHLYCPPM